MGIEEIVIKEAGPWYERLAQQVGPLAATLFIFLAVFGFLAYKISIRVIDAWTDERSQHRAEVKSVRDAHLEEFKMVVKKLDEREQLLGSKIDERDNIIREEILSTVRGYEKQSMACYQALSKVDERMAREDSRPCLLEDQRRAVIEAARDAAREGVSLVFKEFNHG